MSNQVADTERCYPWYGFAELRW